MKADRSIKYLNKDFSSLKQQLIDYAKNYFPETYGDFSEASPGMMFMEMAAYVGDILSFYQDTQVQETFLQYAKNPTNLYNLAYMMGYRPKVTSVATVKLTLTQTVGAIQVSGSYVPDYDSAVRLAEGAVFRSTDASRTQFITRVPVDFKYSSSYDPTVVSIEALDEDDNPTSFILTKEVEAYSGEIQTITQTFGSYQKYPTITIEDTGIVGILSVYEGSNAANEAGTNIWTEVPYLGQDTVFVSEQNTGSESNTAPYILKLQKVPKRFVTRFRSNGVLEMQFGAGIKPKDSITEFIPNPLSLKSNVQEWSSDKYDTAYDPSNFLFTDAYGLVPTDTVLYINYITSNGVRANVGAGMVTEPVRGVPVGANIRCINFEAASGGKSGDTTEELRQNALRAFAEQKRAVTLQDMSIRALAMPPQYGTISKVYAAKESLMNGTSTLRSNSLALTLYVLSEDPNGRLITASNQIKENLKTYMSEYLMLTDALDIRDAYVVNIGVKYSVVIRPGFNSTDVLTRCSGLIEDYFRKDKWTINEPINISDIYNLLSQVAGVQVVKDVKIVDKVGEDLGYTKYAYDTEAATVNNVVYPSYDPCIFELRYPSQDIEGRVVTL